MKYFSLIFIFLITISNVIACEIKTYPLFLLNSNSPLTIDNFIQNSDCSIDTRINFGHQLLNSRGHINLNILVDELNKSGNEKITSISPTRTSIEKIEDYLNNKLFENQEKKIFIGHISSNEDIIAINDHQELEVSCNSCKELGNVLIHLKTPKINNYWVEGKIMTQAKVYKSLSNIDVDHMALDKSLFQEALIYTETPESHFNNLDIISFYKANRPIRVGDLLLKANLSPMVLAKTGKPIKVKLKNSSITLVGRALSLESGTFGQTIRMQNTSSRKIIFGKVTNYNEAVIEL